MPPPSTFNQAQYDDFLAKSGDVYAQSKYRVLLRWMSGRGRLRVLNAGCGSGELSCLLAAAGHQVVGIDPGAEYIELARERAGDRFPDSEFIVSSIEDFAGPGGFDAVISTDVLEHIEDDRTAFAKLAQLTRPGGLVLIAVPAGQWLFGFHDEQLGHFRRYSKSTLRAARLRHLRRQEAAVLRRQPDPGVPRVQQVAAEALPGGEGGRGNVAGVARAQRDAGDRAPRSAPAGYQRAVVR